MQQLQTLIIINMQQLYPSLSDVPTTVHLHRAPRHTVPGTVVTASAPELQQQLQQQELKTLQFNCWRAIISLFALDQDGWV